MEDLIFKYAEEYAALIDKKMDISDQQRTAFNPSVFVFIGDKAYEAVKLIKDDICKKWDNGRGVLFFHIFSEKTHSGESIRSFRMQYPQSGKSELRRNIYKYFYEDRNHLMDLNNEIRRLRQDLSCCGQEYSSFEKVNLAVITRADDPLNILVSEITLLIKAKLQEDFKIVLTDLYTLITEKNHEDFGYSCAAAMSFFREVEYFQKQDFCFDAPIEVLDDTVSLNVTNRRAPIFDLTYILSDKNENGVILENALERNCEIISYISLLKNRAVEKLNYEYDNELYNNNQFKNNINSNSSAAAYSSAGLSKVKRPSRAIAIAVFYHFFNILLQTLKGKSKCDKTFAMKEIGLEEEWFDSVLEEGMKDLCTLDDMMCIMSSKVPFHQLEGMSIGDAHKALYGDVCLKFFEDNYERIIRKNIHNLNLESEIISRLDGKIIQNPKYGLYCGYLWTSESMISDKIENLKGVIHGEIGKFKNELDEAYEEIVQFSPVKKIFLNRKNTLRNFKRYMLEKIYSLKLEILKLEIKLDLIERYEAAICGFHETLKENIEKLEGLLSMSASLLESYLNKEDEYLGQNIRDYYEIVVKNLIQSLKEKYGDDFYFEQKFEGNTWDISKFGPDNLIQRLIKVCCRHILTSEEFEKSFEDELLKRANMNIKYYDKREILSKRELFKELYDILENNAKINIYVLNFTMRCRYEEKYLFGNYESDFVKYAFAADKGIRTYKLGCVHEKRTSGIEKLNLMGGFSIKDVIYAKNCVKYYDTYLKQGYKLHADCREEELPVIAFT